MKVLDNLLYSESHEWIKVEGNEVTVGITDYAQDSLGDIVFIELPAEGDSFDNGEQFGAIESVKAASDLYLPIQGEVVAINEDLEATPELLNSDPYGAWIVKVRLADKADLDELLTPEAYKEFCK